MVFTGMGAGTAKYTWGLPMSYPTNHCRKQLLVGWGGQGPKMTTTRRRQTKVTTGSGQGTTNDGETKNDREGKIVTMMGLTRRQ
jgi:hypothetical protein